MIWNVYRYLLFISPILLLLINYSIERDYNTHWTFHTYRYEDIHNIPPLCCHSLTLIPTSVRIFCYCCCSLCCKCLLGFVGCRLLLRMIMMMMTTVAVRSAPLSPRLMLQPMVMAFEVTTMMSYANNELVYVYVYMGDFSNYTHTRTQAKRVYSKNNVCLSYRSSLP